MIFKPYIDMGMVPTFSCDHYLVSLVLAFPGPAQRLGGKLGYSRG